MQASTTRMRKKKKSKAPRNLIRGYATCSVPSRDQKQNVNHQPTDDEENADEPTWAVQHTASDPTEHNAERFQSQCSTVEPVETWNSDVLSKKIDIEQSHSVQFCKLHSARVKNEADQCIHSIKAELRTLRSRIEPLSTQSVSSVFDKVENLALAEINQGRFYSNVLSKYSQESEDSILRKLLVLYHVLTAMCFDRSSIEKVLRHVFEYRYLISGTRLIWGLTECIDWLVLNAKPGTLPDVDYNSGQFLIGTQDSARRLLQTVSVKHDTPEFPPPGNLDPTLEPVDSVSDKDLRADDEVNSDMSDSNEDDIPPESLVETYIELKTHLYMIEPAMVEQTRTHRDLKASSKRAQRNTSRLLARLQKIERDVLFNSDQALQKWNLIKPKIARERASMQRDRNFQRSNSDSSSKPKTLALDDEAAGRSLPSSSPEAQYSLESLFGERESISAGESGAKLESSITVRNFEDVEGPDPKSLLETSCIACDSAVVLTFESISKSLHSYRHRLKIVWSKAPKFEHTLAFQASNVSVISQTNYQEFKMQKISTPTNRQSKSYISLFAIFYLFSGTVHEKTAHSQLSAPWREVWEEFLTEYDNQQLNAEAAVVDSIKKIIAETEIAFHKTEDSRKEAKTATSVAVEPQDAGARQLSESVANKLSSLQPNRSWQEISSSAKYKEMLVSRTSLPLFQKRDEVIAMVSTEKVSIISGETGSGKSTQVPHFILANEMREGRDCKIIVAEPRRVSAVSLANRVSKELGEDEGLLGTHRSLVGYSIRLESKVSSKTRLIFATTGVVLRILQNRAEGLKLTHLIVDEVHERSVETDFLLVMLHLLRTERPHLKVILMSASMQSEKFSAYFGGAPLLTCSGRTFPVQTWFLEDALRFAATGSVMRTDHSSDVEVNDSSEGAIEQYINEYEIQYSLILKLIEHEISSHPKMKGAILVFLPGLSEILSLKSLLENTQFSHRLAIHQLHSRIPNEIQQQVFIPSNAESIKIVLATNIAETGITIPDVTCVIGLTYAIYTGVHREMRYQERSSISRLTDSFISKANALQRRGRAGRVGPGVCYHLISTMRYNALPAYQTPEILRSSILDVILGIKSYGLGDVHQILGAALDPPPSKKIQQALATLTDLKALSIDECITNLGRCMSRMSLDPYLSKLVIYGSIFGCLDMTSTVAAILSTKSVFKEPNHRQKDSPRTNRRFEEGDSDLLTEYKAYRTWSANFQKDSSSAGRICSSLGLSNDSLLAVEDFKSQILSNLIALKLKSVLPFIQDFRKKDCFHKSKRVIFTIVPEHLNKHNDNNQLLLTVIGWAMYPKLLIKNDDQWCTIRRRQAVKTSFQSSAATAGKNRYQILTFQSIIRSTSSRRNIAHNISPVLSLPLILHVGDVDISQTSHVVTFKDASLRFAVNDDAWGPWKSTLFIHILRRKIESVCQEFLAPSPKPFDASSKLWLDLMNELIDHWKSI